MATRGNSSKKAAGDSGGAQGETDQAPELVGSALGEVAYAAYAEAVDGKSVRGEKLPAWGDQDHKIQVAWCAVGQAVLSATFSRKD